MDESKQYEREGETYDELDKARSAHSENLKSLSMPLAELKRQLPSVPSFVDEASSTMQMKTLLAKVGVIAEQRDVLMQQLRQQFEDDDATTVLAAKDKDEQVSRVL